MKNINCTILLIGLLFTTNLSMAITHISTSTTWSGIVSMTDDIIVDPNVLLTINQGTTINVGNNTTRGFYLEVQGSLTADGSSSYAITFQPTSTTIGWYGIHLNNPTGDCLIDHCIISYVVKTKGSLPKSFFVSGTIFTENISSVEVIISNCDINTNIASWGAAVFMTGSTDNVTIQNCHFSHNLATSGGAIYCEGSVNPVISSTRMDHNQADLYGGAVYFENSSTAVISFCELVLNSSGRDGGGIYCEFHSGADIHDNDIHENDASITSGRGGGIYINSPTSGEIFKNDIHQNDAYGGGGICFDADGNGYMINENNIYSNEAEYGAGVACVNVSSPKILDNFIHSNQASVDGGGICIIHSDPLVKSNTINENSALNNGAGIYMQNINSSRISLNIIRGNDAENLGGGIYCTQTAQGYPEILGNLIVKNASYEGGGIYLDNNTNLPMINNNTIADNEADNDGGGIYSVNGFGANLNFGNNIIWGNLANYSSNSANSTLANSGAFDNFQYCDIEGCTVAFNGLMSNNPLFADPSNNDYRIQLHSLPSSSCIDAGNDLITPIESYDIRGKNRKIDAGSNQIDIGAYEMDPNDANDPILPLDIYNRYDGNNLFSFYPNPATNFVYIMFNFDKVNDVQSILLYNIQGTRLNTILCSNNPNLSKKYKLDISKYTPGIYFVEVEMKNSSSLREKLIIY